MRIVWLIVGGIGIANGLFFLANGIIVGSLTGIWDTLEIIKGIFIGGGGATVFILAYRSKKRD